MSKKCKAYSVSKLGLEKPDNRKAFYAGWDTAIKQAEKCEPVAVVVFRDCEAGESGKEVQFLTDIPGGTKLYAHAEEQASEPAPYKCKYCGCPSWYDPSDQSPPPDYCHESDHGEPEPDLLWRWRRSMSTQETGEPALKREWIGLTDDQIHKADPAPDVMFDNQRIAFAQAIAAKLKELNHG
jgi:hypothetical protein